MKITVYVQRSDIVMSSPPSPPSPPLPPSPPPGDFELFHAACFLQPKNSRFIDGWHWRQSDQQKKYWQPRPSSSGRCDEKHVWTLFALLVWQNFAKFLYIIMNFAKFEWHVSLKIKKPRPETVLFGAWDWFQGLSFQKFRKFQISLS